MVSYSYNSRDELTNETFSGSGSGIAAEAVKLVYDNAGNMTGLTRYSNTAETSVVAATSYTYDNANQLTGITRQELRRHHAGLVRLHLRRGRTGERGNADMGLWGRHRHARLHVHQQRPAHGRDAHGRSFANESFSYDANGNETGTGYTTSTGNEQTASPGYTYTYDADGDMITETHTSTGDVWTYTYNFRNLMTGAVEKTSGGTVAGTGDTTRTMLWTIASAWTKMEPRRGRSMTAAIRSWTSTVPAL